MQQKQDQNDNAVHEETENGKQIMLPFDDVS